MANNIETQFLNNKNELVVGYECVNPFENVTTEEINKEITERMRYYHTHGKPLEGASIKEIDNSNYEFIDGVLYKVKIVRNLKHRMKSSEELTSEDCTMLTSSQSVDLSKFKVPQINKVFLIVPPIPVRKELIIKAHTSSHLGSDKTEHAIKQTYWWKSIRQDVRKFVSGCDCTYNRQRQSNYLKEVRFIIYKPWSHLNMDIAFVQCQSGYVGYLAIIEGFSKFLWVKEIANKCATTVSNILTSTLEEIQLKYGVNFDSIKTIMTHDNGKEFCNSKVKEVLAKFHIIDHSTIPYDPSLNGNIERPNSTIKRALELVMKTLHIVNWVIALPIAITNYNNGMHSVTRRKPIDLLLQVSPIRFDSLSTNNKCAVVLEQLQIIEDVERRMKCQAKRINNLRAKKNGGVEFSIGMRLMIAKPSYAKAVKVTSITKIPKRIGTLVEKTPGGRYFVQWERTGGFLQSEVPFSRSKHPIDPKYFSTRHLGCDDDSVACTEEEYDEIVDVNEQESNDLAFDVEAIEAEIEKLPEEDIEKLPEEIEKLPEEIEKLPEEEIEKLPEEEIEKLPNEIQPTPQTPIPELSNQDLVLPTPVPAESNINQASELTLKIIHTPVRSRANRRKRVTEASVVPNKKTK